jgi:creatinine amidohydrolase
MKVKEMNWMQVEDYLRRDDRAVLPVGSTEQHAQLSLMVDCILSERVAADAAEPLGVPVFPPVNYGITPYFRAFPGTVSLRMETFLGLMRDILASLTEQGFKRIVIVNGHGGNSPAQTLAQEWMTDHPEIRIKFHNWWNAPRTWAKVKLRGVGAMEYRRQIGDGNFGGYYERSDEEMIALWAVAVDETRELIDRNWG